jgi:Zn ribbon nucleic-acid-binding protein
MNFIKLILRVAKLHMPDDMCPINFQEEIKFWGIDDVYLEHCCQGRYHQKKVKKQKNKLFLNNFSGTITR